MNELLGITLLFESLVPLEKAQKITLSVGTVTLLLTKELSDELPLDFKETRIAYDMVSAARGKFYVILKDLYPEAFWSEYKSMGITPDDFTYKFFQAHKSSTYVTEVYTEAYLGNNKISLPLTLTKMHLYFSNGLVLDYTDRISVFALKELAEVA